MSVAETRADQRLADDREAASLARDMELGTADVSGFSDWLFAECQSAAPVQLRERIADVTAEDFAGKPAEALAVAMDPGQPALTRVAALDALMAGHAGWVAAWREQCRQREQARERSLAMVQAFTRREAA